MSKFNEILNSSNPSDALLGEQIDKLMKFADNIVTEDITDQITGASGCKVDSAIITKMFDKIAVLNCKVTLTTGVTSTYGVQFNIPNWSRNNCAFTIECYNDSAKERPTLSGSLSQSSNVCRIYGRTATATPSGVSGRFTAVYLLN